MKETYRMRQFLIEEMFDTINEPVPPVFIRSLAFRFPFRWTMEQCSSFQDAAARKLSRAFRLTIKEAQNEVSWFVERYGFKVK